MKQFSFKFDKILNYREYLEKRAIKDLMVLRTECMEKENRVEKLISKKSENIAQCRARVMRGMDAAVYKVYQVFTKKLDNDLEGAHKELQENRERVNAQEKILQQTSIKKKSLETLKDFKLKNYAKRVAQEEQKFMDEMAVIKSGANK